MSEIKNFKLIKTTSGNVLFILHPASNPSLSRRIFLTNKNPQQSLPLDWALGVFSNPGVYSLYKKKLITFDHNEELVKEAFEAGVYFDTVLDFTPASPDRTKEILAVLKAGNRQNILNLIEKEGKEAVRDVTLTYANDLTQGVVRMLEGIFNIQITIDGE